MNREISPDVAEELGRSIGELLKISPSDTRFIPLADELTKALRSAFPSSEALERYRKVRDRMASAPEQFIIPPNFPYTVHSA